MSMSMKNSPIIAVDFDDVLVATNQAAACWHNKEYGTSMTLDHFYYYHWWKNPGWGNTSAIVPKVYKFYDAPEFRDAAPIPHAFECCQHLVNRGYRLVIVTARSDEQRGITEAAIAKHFPGIFHKVYFSASVGGRGTSQMTKAQILRQIGAVLMIDDSLDNTLDCANDGIPTLLFGKYLWNRRRSRVVSPVDKMGFDQRGELEGRDSQWWHKDDIPDSALPKRAKRVDDWHDVLQVILNGGLS